MKNWLSLRMLFLVGISVLFSIVVSAKSADENSAFKIRAYHQHIFPDRQPIGVFHQRLEDLAKFDYNMVVFGMGLTKATRLHCTPWSIICGL